jgi:asparagine synthase (glutamine-hydrolysing)
MSGIAAVIRFDGGPIEPGTIERMTAAMGYRGPDGIAHWQRGPVALGHCMLHTTTESLEEVQPLCNEDESLVLVMDGWLSNWEELRADLLSRGARLRTRSDAELVLRAFEAWGDDCPRHIDGEYSFLIWDARRHEVFCARDHAGLRPFNYHWDGKRLVVASDIVGVLACPEVPQAMNRGMIAEIITDDCYSRDETIWQGVMRLIPAHWSRFAAGGPRSQRYWMPPLEVSIRYDTDAEYFEHYRELFADCVRRSARSHLRVACDVSGGLDSSAIFAMAHALRRDGRLCAPGLNGYTLLNEAGTPGDEIEYARAVASHVGEPVREVPPFMPDLDWFVQRARDDRDVAPAPNGAMAISLGEALRADGCRVSLTGDGGDEWLTGRRWYYNEQLREGDWSGFAESFRRDAAQLGLGEAMRLVVRFGMAPLIPQPILDARRKLLSNRRLRNHAGVYWLSAELETVWDARRAQRDTASIRSVKNLARRAMFMELNNSYCLLAHERMNRQSARTGFDMRYPMYARPFIEFAFATPEHLRLRGAMGKNVHIQSLNDLLPELVAKRTSKAEFSLAFTRHLDRMKGLLVDEMPRNGNGNLDSAGLARLYDCYCRAPYGQKPVWELWGIFSCEGVFGTNPGWLLALATGEECYD